MGFSLPLFQSITALGTDAGLMSTASRKKTFFNSYHCSAFRASDVRQLLAVLALSSRNSIHLFIQNIICHNCSPYHKVIISNQKEFRHLFNTQKIEKCFNQPGKKVEIKTEIYNQDHIGESCFCQLLYFTQQDPGAKQKCFAPAENVKENTDIP